MKRILTILSILISCSVSAQTGTADTIYVDVPAEVEALRMQTTECIVVGKKDKERFGKKFRVRGKTLCIKHRFSVWYGSMNFLSREREDDNLMRIESKSIAQEVFLRYAQENR